MTKNDKDKRKITHNDQSLAELERKGVKVDHLDDITHNPIVKEKKGKLTD